jgi:hypothetical protein
LVVWCLFVVDLTSVGVELNVVLKLEFELGILQVFFLWLSKQLQVHICVSLFLSEVGWLCRT